MQGRPLPSALGVHPTAAQPHAETLAPRVVAVRERGRRVRPGSRLASQRPGSPKAAHISAFLSIHISWLAPRGQGPCPSMGTTAFSTQPEGGQEFWLAQPPAGPPQRGTQRAVSSKPSGACPAWAYRVRGRTSRLLPGMGAPIPVPAGPPAPVSQPCSRSALPTAPLPH